MVVGDGVRTVRLPFNVLFSFFYTIWRSDIFSLELASDANFSRPAREIEQMWEGKVGTMEWKVEWSKGNSVAQYR